jgi:hypothetical protein
MWRAGTHRLRCQCAAKLRYLPPSRHIQAQNCKVNKWRRYAKNGRKCTPLDALQSNF